MLVHVLNALFYLGDMRLWIFLDQVDLVQQYFVRVDELPEHQFIQGLVVFIIFVFQYLKVFYVRHEIDCVDEGHCLVELYLASHSFVKPESLDQLRAICETVRFDQNVLDLGSFFQ